MKKLLALALTTMMMASTVQAAPATDGEYKDLYPLTGIVTEVHEVDKGTDLVTMTCANGNQFSWYTDNTDDWCINDLASCIMNSNGTDEVYDDEIVDAHYVGTLDQLSQYTA